MSWGTCTAAALATAYFCNILRMYYDLAYKPQPLPFRTGANDGFHEGIGDTLALSCNAAYLRQAARSARSCRDARGVTLLDEGG